MDNKKIKVLIGDDSAEYGITCANELRALGLYVVTRRKDGKVILDAIRNDTPDVVVMDAVLPGMDAIEILEKSQTFAHAPAFIITSSYENTFIERQVMEKGAAYFMLKPFHISALGNRITELASNGIPDKEASAHRTLEMVVTEMIHQLGVPAHIKGYHYLLSFRMYSAIGLRQILPWQMNKIFVIAYISLQKPPSLDISRFLALLSFLLSCRKPTHIPVTLRRFSGKWCSNWCSDCDCFNLIFSAAPVRQTL